LATEKKLYWVTAAHVMVNQDGSAETLRIFPRDTARTSLPFDIWVRIQSPEHDSDGLDLYILRVDLKDFDACMDSEAIAQRVEDGLLDPSELDADDELIVVGYPSTYRAIDYENLKINYRRSIYKTRFLGPSPIRNCYQLRFESGHSLGSFDGLSGGAVFRNVECGQFVLPVLTGILLRGTPMSGICHFVSAGALQHVLVRADTS